MITAIRTSMDKLIVRVLQVWAFVTNVEAMDHALTRFFDILSPNLIMKYVFLAQAFIVIVLDSQGQSGGWVSFGDVFDIPFGAFGTAALLVFLSEWSAREDEAPIYYVVPMIAQLLYGLFVVDLTLRGVIGTGALFAATNYLALGLMFVSVIATARRAKKAERTSEKNETKMSELYALLDKHGIKVDDA